MSVPAKRMSSTSILEVKSDSVVRQFQTRSDLKELAKDLGNIGKEVGKGMLSMLGWPHRTRRLPLRRKREEKKEALKKLESLKVPPPCHHRPTKQPTSRAVIIVRMVASLSFCNT